MSSAVRSELVMSAPARRRCNEIADILRQLTASSDIYVSTAECRQLLIDPDAEIPWTKEDTSGAPVFARPWPFAEWAELYAQYKARHMEQRKFELDQFPEEITEDLRVRAMSEEELIAKWLEKYPGDDLSLFEVPKALSSFEQAYKIHNLVVRIVLASDYGKKKDESLLNASSWRLLPIREHIEWNTHRYHQVSSDGNLPRFTMCTSFRPIPWPQPPNTNKSEWRALEKNFDLGYRILMSKKELEQFAHQEPYPYLACVLISEAGPGDDAEQEKSLLRSEMIAAFCMIADLMRPAFNHKFDTFPVFVYSFVGLKVRILQVHHDPVRNINIVRKTSFVEIKGPDDMINARMVVSWILNKPCGVTRGVVKTCKRQAAADTQAAARKKVKQTPVEMEMKYTPCIESNIV